MKLKTPNRLLTDRLSCLDYTQMSLLELVRQITVNSDTDAINELHQNRTLFRYKDDDMLLMANYMVRLKHRDIAKQWCGGDSMVLEKAYDHALAKFLNIPKECDNECASAETEGPDCRYYYEAFYNYATTRLEAKPPANMIEAELMAANIFQRMVMRHFYLSCLECKRQGQDLIRRYGWKINGHTLYIWLPTEMPGRRCQKWLCDNVPDVDPTRSGERDRVQMIINQLLGKPRIVPLHDMNGEIRNVPAKPDNLHSIIEEEISANGLARVVANEKADNIEKQRPAIRHMGANRLKELVLGVFDSITCGNYEAVSFFISAFNCYYTIIHRYIINL